MEVGGHGGVLRTRVRGARRAACPRSGTLCSAIPSRIRAFPLARRPLLASRWDCADTDQYTVTTRSKRRSRGQRTMRTSSWLTRIAAFALTIGSLVVVTAGAGSAPADAVALVKTHVSD